MASVEGKYIHEIERAPSSILDDDALFVVGFNKLTSATTFGNIKRSLNGDTKAPSSDLYYSSKFVDDRLDEIDENFTNINMSVNNTETKIEDLRTHVNTQDASLLQKIETNKNTIIQNRNHWQMVLYGDLTTNTRPDEVGVIPSIKGHILELKKALYGGTSLFNNTGQIADIPEEIYSKLSKVGSILKDDGNLQYPSGDASIVDIYASLNKLHERISNLYEFLFIPDSREKEKTAAFSNTIGSSSFTFNNLQGKDVLDSEKTVKFQVDKLWASINYLLMLMGPKVDYMYKTIAGSEHNEPTSSEIAGIYTTTINDVDGGDGAVLSNVPVPVKNINLGDIIRKFENEPLNFKQQTETYNNQKYNDDAHKFNYSIGNGKVSNIMASDIKLFMNQIVHVYNADLYKQPASFFMNQSDNPALSRHIASIDNLVLNKEFESLELKKEATDISLLKRAIVEIGYEIKTIRENAVFTSRQINSGVYGHLSTPHATIVHHYAADVNHVLDVGDGIAGIKIGSSVPTSLKDGEIYLQYF